MPEPLTALFAGRFAVPHLERVKALVRTDWRFERWQEGDDFLEFRRLARTADAIVAGRVRGHWPELPKLRLYQIPFTGHDWIGPEDVPAGCPVCNAYEHEIAIAEYVFAAMLEWEIRLCQADRRFRTHSWEGNLPGIGPRHGELYGKRLGILGYGHIGREVAGRAKAFGMHVSAIARRKRRTPPMLDWYGTIEELDRLMAESDYVLVAVPLAPETDGIVDAGRLAAMKATGVIVNVGRGRVVDEKALYEALADRRIGGAIVDVWYQYPRPGDPSRPPSQYPYDSLDNVVMTPHFSARTQGTSRRRWAFVARNLDRLARGQRLQNVVFEGTGQGKK